MNTSTGHHHKDGITRQDVYTRVTDRIVADLERGVRTWVKPWNAEHATGKITRPLRHNGVPYSGINILMLWSAAVAGGFAAPIWMTFKQALELNAHVRKGEKGSSSCMRIPSRARKPMVKPAKKSTVKSTS